MDLHEVIPQRQLAALLGVSEGRVSQLVSDGVIPAGAPVSAQVAAYCENLRAVAAGRSDTPEIATERARLLAAQAKREELRLAEDQGALIRVDAVRTVLEHAFIMTREFVMNIPARVAPQLAAESDAATIQTMLHAALHAALTELAAAPLKLGSPQADSSNLETAGAPRAAGADQ